MNQTEVIDTRMSEVVPSAFVSALSGQFASRGLARSASLEATEMMEAEERTRAIDPSAYRLSLLSDAAVEGIYRRGKNMMEASDLLRYAEECRKIKQRENPVEAVASIYECAAVIPEPKVEEQTTAMTRFQSKAVAIGKLPTKALTIVKERFPLWFHFKPSDTSAEKNKMPVSAFAAILAIAVSLMLIVASALMITHTETKISKLNSEIATLHSEIDDIEGKLEAEADLMEIRRIAVEEYGMVDEDHLKMEHLSLDSTEDVQVYAQGKNREIGLSSILSAIGWKK